MNTTQRFIRSATRRAVFGPGIDGCRPMIVFVETGADLLEEARRRTIEAIAMLEAPLPLLRRILPKRMSSYDATDFSGPGIGMHLRGGVAIHSVRSEGMGGGAKRTSLVVQEGRRRTVVFENTHPHPDCRQDDAIGLDASAPRKAALRMARLHLGVIEAAMADPCDEAELRGMADAAATMIGSAGDVVILPSPINGPAMITSEPTTKERIVRSVADETSIPVFVGLHLVAGRHEESLSIHMAWMLATSDGDAVGAMRRLARMGRKGS